MATHKKIRSLINVKVVLLFLHPTVVGKLDGGQDETRERGRGGAEIETRH